MIQFECLLARLTSAVGIPNFAMNGQEQVLKEIFEYASSGDIQLNINNKPLWMGVGQQRGFWALDLHMALMGLTHNPSPPAPSQRIAVLYADFYKPFSSALGVMFDRGFDPGDDPSSATEFRQSPREGCAVFLGAIAKLRGDPNQAEDEALFTTIHELGHVFNLQHVNRPINFMAQSEAAGPFQAEAYQFLDMHRMALSNCSRSPNVWPGGSAFNETGKYTNYRTGPNREPRHQDFGLELALSMQQREFWHFEPVELDIELRVVEGVQRSFRVPDAIDPGYESFEIWIEEPTRERRRYRSPRRYCSTGKRRTIKPGRSFRRDISLFGEAGGYTFRVPGVHRIWAEFTVRPGAVLRSNELEVNVMEPSQSDSYTLASRILSAPPRAKSLYHRLFRSANQRNLLILKDYCDTAPRLQSIGAIRYAVARIMAEQASAANCSLPHAAAEQLRRALDSPELGLRQRELALRLLKEP
ncbi:hypothetical protein [Pseudomonas frederiksbergensis]|uniref:hypothetical protein n=1 Tax=Pseudomonas frederiksbergensis TaxID=104087 RepID=UPI003D1B2F75